MDRHPTMPEPKFRHSYRPALRCNNRANSMSSSGRTADTRTRRGQGDGVSLRSLSPTSTISISSTATRHPELTTSHLPDTIAASLSLPSHFIRSRPFSRHRVTRFTPETRLAGEVTVKNRWLPILPEFSLTNI